MRRILMTVMAGTVLTGCAALPASGPWNKSIGKSSGMLTMNPASEAEQEDDVLEATLIRLTPKFVGSMNTHVRPEADIVWPPEGRPTNSPVNVNDVVQITIYESQTGGLFVPQEAGVRPGNYVTLPVQEVDRSGTITVPYAGKIKVVGKSPSTISAEIAELLSQRAIEPQIVVSVLERRGAQVSVLGDVRAPANFSLSLDGDRLLDGIARAGGPVSPEYESWVSVQRGGKEYSLRMDEILEEPSRNFYLNPEDTVYVSREPETFQAFGASGFNGIHEFEKRDIKLTDALGRARGLRDDLADPAEVYIFRHENVAYLKEVDDLDWTIYEPGDENHDAPIVYQVNLREPQGYFLAQNFEMRDKDVIYIANSETVEFSKFLSFLSAFTGTKITTQSAVEQ